MDLRIEQTGFRDCCRLVAVLLSTAAIVSAACPPPLRPMGVANVVNAASFKTGISSNSLFSIFGQEFTPAGFGRQAGADDLVGGKFPTELACIAVEVDGERVPITYAGGVQINAQAPAHPLPNPLRVTVIRNPGQSDEVRAFLDGVQTQPYAPAFFTFDGRMIAAQSTQYAPLSDPGKPPFGRRATPGEVVLLYANGFGYTEPVWQAGEITDRISWLKDPVEISIGGVTLAPQDIYYTGLGFGAISGLYQFNVRVPAQLEPGDAQVIIRIGGYQTQPEAVLPVGN